MSNFSAYTRYQLNFALEMVGSAAYTILAPLEMTAWRTPEPVPFADRTTGQELSLKIGDRWGSLFDCAWFRFRGTVPGGDGAAGRKVVLLLDVNGEMLVVNSQGNPVRGLTNVASDFDKSLGLPGKRVYPLFDQAKGGESLEVWADAGMNDLFGRVQGNGQIQEASIAACNEETLALYYDMEVLLDSLLVLPEASARAHQIVTALNDAVHILWNGINEEASRQARHVLAPVLNQCGGDPSLQVSAIGHAHMDLAWLWPIRETKRKGARTFATALANLEKYPDYIFAASQPQLFQWMKESYPSLYERIKDKVKEGRIEPQGALWVECDANLTGGESLVRQILYGSQFFKNEFGIEPTYVWLPDTFGYSAALPQIIRKAGMKYFSTQKLSWSTINKFPHHSFHWQGIDGTPVLVHMLPEETYNSAALPRSIGKIEANYAEKGISEHALMVFGIGDGGGGPGEEHLERLAREKNFAGLSPVHQEWTEAFFERWAQSADRFPTWVGELYLERHQGTLTSNARNKWYNRRLEQSLRELEWLASIAAALGLADYPAGWLEETWKEVLLYQFHDILPGSSIKRVYDESLARYAVLYAQVEEKIKSWQSILTEAIRTDGLQRPEILFNSLSWERSEWVQAGEGWQKLNVPAMGYALIDTSSAESEPAVALQSLSASPSRLENDLLQVTFAENGAIRSIYDRQSRREVIPPGEQANRLAVFVDHGDAWDFPADYSASSPFEMPLVSSQARVEGPNAVVEQVYRLGGSELHLEVSLQAGSPRIDFSARLRWRQPRTMLRALFPVQIFAEQAAFEIQYGHVFRSTHTNTTWDLAKDEVPAQKWVDLSQRDYGVALINDSKYGHRIKGHTMELNLLRSVPYTGPRLVADEDVADGEAHHAYSDQSDHVFRYALLPHSGDFVAGEVIQQAYQFNIPLRRAALQAHAGQGPLAQSWIEVSQPGVIVETVKQAEDGQGLILRLYESTRAACTVSLRLGIPFSRVEETDLLERSLHELTVSGSEIELAFNPFEIKTIRVRPPVS